MNKIVIELCADDRQRLDALVGALSLLSSVIGSTLPPTVQQDIAAIPAVEHPVDAPTAHFDPPAPAPVPVPLGEFQKALVTRCAESAETKQKVQALVHKYADSVSNVPEDKRSEVLAALAEI